MLRRLLYYLFVVAALIFVLLPIKGATLPAPNEHSYKYLYDYLDTLITEQKEIQQRLEQEKAQKAEQAQLEEQLKIVTETNNNDEWDDIEAEVYNVSAYTVGDDYTPSHGITASGEKVKANYTAACPSSLPFGTKLYILDLDHVYTCKDRGGFIKGKKLDIYMDNKREASKFGRKNLKVKVKKPLGK